MHQWYYRKTDGLDGQQVGPVTGRELKQLAYEGEINPSDEVASPTRTRGKWIVVSRISVLNKHFNKGQEKRDAANTHHIHFPKIEAAAKSLLERRTENGLQFDELSDLNDETIAVVRTILASEILEGTSLCKFTKKVQKEIGKSAIDLGQLESIYRTNLQAAFRDGQASVMANPILAAVFPYMEYIPIHDARTRKNHRLLGELGLDGTGVYRRDDPFWSIFSPPWEPSCRCGTNNLTIEAAARKGVKEAIKWQETGTPPETPEHRLVHIPFRR